MKLSSYRSPRWRKLCRPLPWHRYFGLVIKEGRDQLRTSGFWNQAIMPPHIMYKYEMKDGNGSIDNGCKRCQGKWCDDASGRLFSRVSGRQHSTEQKVQIHCRRIFFCNPSLTLACVNVRTRRLGCPSHKCPESYAATHAELPTVAFLLTAKVFNAALICLAHYCHKRLLMTDGQEIDKLIKWIWTFAAAQA